MPETHSILVFHPGAIGDVMLATPVLAALKANFPQAKTIYAGHASVEELVNMTGCVDEFVAYDKRLGLLAMRQKLLARHPDLIVDLSGKLKSRLMTCWSQAKVFRYRKQAASVVPQQHAVENFLATLKPLNLVVVEPVFPSIFLPDALLAQVRIQLGTGKPKIALVPGVGNLRPHRAWPKGNWIELAQKLGASCDVIYVGGADEAELAEEIARQGGGLNLCGKLSLVETAAALKLCRLAISGDTGPCHIAVAVGTEVLGLYGPTYAQRSGPYGSSNLLIDHSHHCRCHNHKECQLLNCPGPGKCMMEITVEEVLIKLKSYLN